MSSSSADVSTQNQGPTILAACWVLVILPTIIVGLRLWCKLGLSRRGFGLDDGIILIALVRPPPNMYSTNPTLN